MKIKCSFDQLKHRQKLPPHFRHGLLLSKILLILLALMRPGAALLSQPSPYSIQFERIGGRQGLHSSEIKHIHQDSLGFLWLSTFSGLFRYDGHGFKVYKNGTGDPHGLFSNLLDKTYQSNSGRLWAITEYGRLHLFDAAADLFRPYKLHVEKGGGDDPVFVECLLEDRQGVIWVGTKKFGLCRLDPASGNLSRQPLHPGRTEENVYSILEDLQGNLWVAAQGLFCLKPTGSNGAGRELTSVSEFQDVHFYIRLIDKSGAIWMGNEEPEITRFEPLTGKTRRYSIFNKSSGGTVLSTVNDVTAMLEDRQGIIWVATNPGGIGLLDHASGRVNFLKYDRNDPQSLSSNAVTNIFQDRSGIIWVATWGGGLNKHDPTNRRFGHQRHLRNNPKTLGNPTASNFCETPDGSVWVSSGIGLSKFKRQEGSFERFFVNRPNVKIFSIQPVQTGFTGTLWVGTSSGLMLFDAAGGHFSKWHSPNPEDDAVENDMVYFLENDAAGTLWAITYAPYALFRFDAAAGFFHKVDFLPEADMKGETAFYTDWQKHAWAGTPTGRLYKFDLNTRQTTVFQIDPADTSGFPLNYANHAWFDRKNRQWFGTYKGLFLMLPAADGAPVRFRRFTEQDGLAGIQVQAIQEDKQGNLWVSTNNGLSKFHPDELQAGGRLFFRNYKAADGLQSDEFGYHSSHAGSRTGELFFGGINGFNVFFPESIREDTVPPKVVITDVKVLINNEMARIPFDPANPAPLRLSHLEKLITIGFAALHFADPERNGYACKLEGFDKDWRYIGNQHEVTYTNLDAGNYTFLVKACNKDGVWNEQGTLLKIKVLPPWWRTWWAYLAYAVMLGLSAYQFYQFQLNRKLEKAEAERIKEVDSLKTRLYANITHEFRTPLTVIMGMTEQLAVGSWQSAVSASDRAKLKEVFSLILRNSKNLLRLINQMLDLSKLEAGTMKVEAVQGDIINFLQYLTESFHSMAHEKKIQLTFYTEVSELKMDFDEAKIQQIVYNLLSNALKFTGEGGKVVLHTNRTERKGQSFLQLKVQDTGVGIPEGQLGYIFNRFYQVDSTLTRKGEGTGIGLAHTKELVELMGGNISVQSELGRGSIFTLLLPVRLEANTTPAKAEFQTTQNATIELSPELPGADFEDDENAVPGGEKPLLLIIEDNADMATYIINLLEKDYDIRTALNGQAGIEKAIELVPDIIISDVMMPEKDGYEVCETLKNDERTSHIPIILLTAKAEEADRITGLRKGADAYLMKPFNKVELQVRLEKLVELRQALQRRYETNRFDNFPKVVKSGAPFEHTLEDIFIQKIQQTIDAKMDDAELGILDLCRAVHLSHTQVFRKLKALTGLNPTLFIRKKRLQRAAELLKTTNSNIAEIAYTVGFTDPNYFSRAFHEEFGVPPSAMRN